MESDLKETITGAFQRTVLPLEGVRLPKSRILVLPLYDAPTVGGLLEIPDSAQNPQSQQGFVVASGPLATFVYPDLVLFRSWSDHPPVPIRIGGIEFLSVANHNVVARAVGNELEPRVRHVAVRPDFTEFDAPTPSGLLYLPPHSARDDVRAPFFGTIIALGAGCREVQLHQRVVIPPRGGYEIGFISENLYLIPETELLAVME